MFLGHYALAFAAKRLAPRTSLGTTTLAAQLLDNVWPLLLVLGIEHVRVVPGLMAASPMDFTDYPWSHSLATCVCAGLLFGGIYYAVRRDVRGAWVVGALVVSHWVLDALFHRPDLPLWPFGDHVPKVGLGLWNSLPITLLSEFALYGLGVFIYARTTTARDRTGTVVLWVLVVFLPVAYLAALFGPPPTASAVGYSALLLWLIPPVAYYFDRHRRVRS